MAGLLLEEALMIKDKGGTGFGLGEGVTEGRGVKEVFLEHAEEVLMELPSVGPSGLGSLEFCLGKGVGVK